MALPPGAGAAGGAEQRHAADGDVALCLCHWASTLRELVLSTSGNRPCRLDFLSSLQQLTLLNLSTTTPTAADLRWVSGVEQLRSLGWRAGVAEKPEGLLELPLPPRLQRVWVSGARGHWRFPAQLSALVGLQTLALDYLWRDELPASFGELTALTSLDISQCDRDSVLFESRPWEVLLSICQCPSLRYLEYCCYLSAPKTAAACCGSCRTSRCWPRLFAAWILCQRWRAGLPRHCGCWTSAATPVPSPTPAG